MKSKIGQILTIEEDFKIITGICGNEIIVKKGDTGYVDSKGAIHYLTGAARGKIQVGKDIKIKGYDYESIATLIYKRLHCEYELGDMFGDYDIEKKEFIDSIEDILNEIL